jgi:NitT/TauT family transport system permease protein
VVWAQKFRVEESGQQEAMSSWFYDVVRRSRLLPEIGVALRRARGGVARRVAAVAARGPAHAHAVAARAVPVLLSRVVFLALVLALAFGAFRLLHLFRAVPPAAWLALGGSGLLTLGRVVVATVVGTLWALPAGIAVGLSPRLSRLVQPVAQVLASFPAPMLFPAVIAVLHAAGVELGWGSIVLMLLGTQWYIFFNVIAGAVAVPADLREAARSYRFSLWYRLRAVYLPSVFPYLVTGWVTATGGAWNASIVAEYVTFEGHVLTAPGLGAAISDAAERADLSRLAAAVTVMSVIVVIFNRVVWHTLYRISEERFSLDK